MSKLAKYKAGLSRAKSAAVRLGGGAEKVGKAGHEIIKFGVHAGLALASKNVDSLGPVPLKPDAAGLGAGLLAMMLGKGKTRALGRSVATGAAHALITRWIATDSINLISGVDINPKKVVDATAE